MSAAARAFLIWLLAMLAGAVVVWNSHFSADMSFFLPARPSGEQQVLVDQLKEGVVSRLLMVAIEGGDAAQRADISRRLRGQLEKMPEFIAIQPAVARNTVRPTAARTAPMPRPPRNPRRRFKLSSSSSRSVRPASQPCD